MTSQLPGSLSCALGLVAIGAFAAILLAGNPFAENCLTSARFAAQTKGVTRSPHISKAGLRTPMLSVNAATQLPSASRVSDANPTAATMVVWSSPLAPLLTTLGLCCIAVAGFWLKVIHSQRPKPLSSLNMAQKDWAIAATSGDITRRTLLANVATVTTSLLLSSSMALAEDELPASDSASPVVGDAIPAVDEAVPVEDTTSEVKPAPQPVRPKTILITGSNSGIGLDGATKLARRGYRVILACRTLAKAEEAKAEILKAVPTASPDNVIPLACDLASLSSVRACAEQVKKYGPLDVLVLNAGVQFTGIKEVPRTADGFELTIGTNHLGHFLLANLLLPQVAPKGRIVVTASEVHDPKSPGGQVGKGANLGDLSGLVEHPDGRFVMIDGDEYDAEKAYKDSKLCNILFARELQRRLVADGSDVTVVAFGPGLITRTGFFRNQPALFVKVFDFATNDLFRVAETVSGGGDCLVYMTETEGLPKAIYYNNQLDFGNGFGKHAFVETTISEEAMDAEKGKKLWDLSAKLVGLSA